MTSRARGSTRSAPKKEKALASSSKILEVRFFLVITSFVGWQLMPVQAVVLYCIYIVVNAMQQ